MFSSHTPYDDTVYATVLKLNRSRAKLYLERGDHVFPRSAEEVTQYLKDGYFINIMPQTNQRGDTSFKFEIVYSCTSGCCYSYAVDSLDGTSEHHYKNLDMFKQIAPAEWARWAYFSSAERQYIDALFEKEEHAELAKLAEKLIGDLSLGELIEKALQVADAADAEAGALGGHTMRVPRGFDITRWMNS